MVSLAMFHLFHIGHFVHVHTYRSSVRSTLIRRPRIEYIFRYFDRLSKCPCYCCENCVQSTYTTNIKPISVFVLHIHTIPQHQFPQWINSIFLLLLFTIFFPLLSACSFVISFLYVQSKMINHN